MQKVIKDNILSICEILLKEVEYLSLFLQIIVVDNNSFVAIFVIICNLLMLSNLLSFYEILKHCIIRIEIIIKSFNNLIIVEIY